MPEHRMRFVYKNVITGYVRIYAEEHTEKLVTMFYDENNEYVPGFHTPLCDTINPSFYDENADQWIYAGDIIQLTIEDIEGSMTVEGTVTYDLQALHLEEKGNDFGYPIHEYFGDDFTVHFSIIGNIYGRKLY